MEKGHFGILREGDEYPPFIGEADVRGTITKFTHLLNPFPDMDEQLQRIGWFDDKRRRCSVAVYKNTIKLYDETI
jgi:hypothetical protein